MVQKYTEQKRTSVLDNFFNASVKAVSLPVVKGLRLEQSRIVGIPTPLQVLSLSPGLISFLEE